MRFPAGVDLQGPTALEEENFIHNCARREGKAEKSRPSSIHPREVEAEQQANPLREQHADTFRSLGKQQIRMLTRYEARIG